MAARVFSNAALIVVACVVSISAQAPDRATVGAQGSGFVLTADGYIATAYHVVRDAARIEIEAPNHKGVMLATLVRQSEENDLAIVRAEGLSSDAIPISFAAGSAVKLGQDAFVLGYPLGALLGSTVRLSTGSIDSLFGVGDDPRMFQISTPVQPGNSGGPLFNSDGQLIGVVVAQLDAGVLFHAIGIIPQNVNFAIKASLLKELVDTLPGHEAIDARPNALARLSRARQIEVLTPQVVRIVTSRHGADTASSVDGASKTQTPGRGDYDQGEHYRRGDGVAADPSKAASSFQRACDAGDFRGCVSLGLQYANGSGVARDDSRAVALYRTACDARNARGCADLGYMTDKGRGIEKDVPGAAALFQTACDGDDMYGCANLAGAYAGGWGVALDDVRSVALGQRACDGGNAIGCRRLGTMYERGRGIAKDETRAAALYQRACDSDDSAACDNLGRLYDDGRGVAKDDPRAVALFERSCESGDATGCGDLARLYAVGRGVARDESRAVTLYQKACDGANATSCAQLASMYEYGTGVAKDVKRAIELYQAACKANDRASCAAAARLSHP